MIKITIEDVSVLTALQDLKSKLTDLAPAMKEIGEELTASTKSRFASGQSPTGAAWAPNKPVTVSLYLGIYSGGY